MNIIKKDEIIIVFLYSQFFVVVEIPEWMVSHPVVSFKISHN